MDDLQKKLEERLLQSINYTMETSDEEILSEIDTLFLEEPAIRIHTVEERKKLKEKIFCSLRGLDFLEQLLKDDTITEIMINGTDMVFVEREGRMEKIQEHFSSQEKLMQVIGKIAGECNRIVNEVSPILDARLADGSRVNIVLAPIALNGPVVTIRRFYNNPVTMEQMIAWNSISREAAEDLRRMVMAGYNIFISGGTGSGKTTLLNALSGYIPKDERIITIEDSAELKLQDIPNLIRMETRNENVEGCHAITIRDLIRSSLRMRPDRIIVGEVRGAEAVDMLTAFSTGHDGSMSTGHANTARDMLSRLENMFLMGMDIPLAAIRKQIASAIDILVHLGRTRDKKRKVLEIMELEGFVDGEIRMHTLYRYDGNALIKEGEIKNDKKLKAAGLKL